MTELSATFADFERSLSTVVRLLEERETIGEIAQRCGYALPPASWSLLEHLSARGELRVSQIAACHGVDVSSITPRLQSLEGMGLVSRRRDDADGRVHLIEISPSGLEALRRIHHTRCELLSGLLGDDIDPSEVTAAAAVLARLASRLESVSPPSAPPPPALTTP